MRLTRQHREQARCHSRARSRTAAVLLYPPQKSRFPSGTNLRLRCQYLAAVGPTFGSYSDNVSYMTPFF